MKICKNAYVWSQIKASGSGQLVFSCDSGHFFSPESALQHKRKHPFVVPLKKKYHLAVFPVPQVFILSWNCTPMVNSYVRIWSGEVTNTRMTARPVLHTLLIHFLVFVLTWSSWSNVLVYTHLWKQTSMILLSSQKLGANSDFQDPYCFF